MNILVILQLGLVSLIFNATNFEDIVFIFHYTSRQVFMHECPLPDFPREKPITKEWSGNILTSSQVKIFIFFPFLCESRVLDSKENLSQPFFIAVGTWRITWSIIRIFEKPLPPLSLSISLLLVVAACFYGWWLMKRRSAWEKTTSCLIWFGFLNAEWEEEEEERNKKSLGGEKMIVWHDEKEQRVEGWFF